MWNTFFNSAWIIFLIRMWLNKCILSHRGAREMIRSIKCLTLRCEVLGSSPMQPVRRQGIAGHAWNRRQVWWGRDRKISVASLPELVLWWLFWVVNLTILEMNYYLERESVLVLQNLRQEDNMPLIQILRLEDTGFYLDLEAEWHTPLIQILRKERTPLTRATPSAGSL